LVTIVLAAKRAQKEKAWSAVRYMIMMIERNKLDWTSLDGLESGVTWGIGSDVVMRGDCDAITIAGLCDTTVLYAVVVLDCTCTRIGTGVGSF